jgi:hypothetical protein
MNNENPLVANLTIDLKRSRFRIHKKTLCYLDNPAFVQFLINPEELYIAILGSDKPLPGGTANKVNINTSNKNPVDFYSSPLMDRLFEAFSTLNYRYSYHLAGEVDQANRVAYFSLHTLKIIERRAGNDRQGA